MAMPLTARVGVTSWQLLQADEEADDDAAKPITGVGEEADEAADAKRTR